MVLHLAHHKSYHPYNAVNIERVRKDEEEAARANDVEEQRTLVADSEARIANLRKAAKKRLKGEQNAAEDALDRQLSGRPAAVDEGQSRAVILRPPPAATAAEANSSIELDGHINFWADQERGKTVAVTKNAEHEAEERKKSQKWEEMITMYIREPPKPWYADASLSTPKERTRTEEERAEGKRKSEESKRLGDPLAVMQGYLERRERVVDAQERMRKDPWNATPRSLIDPSPVQPSLLRPKKRARRTPSPDPNDFAPPPPPRAKVDAKQEARSREMSERDRAKALLAKVKRGGTSTVTNTPRSEMEFGTGQYNAAATAKARGLSNMRWDDYQRRDHDDRHRDRRRYDDDRGRYGEEERDRKRRRR